MKKFLKKDINKWSIIIFLFLLFVLRIPPFYVIPVESKVFSSHSFSKLFIICLLVINIFVKNKEISKVFSMKKPTALVYIFFLTQSLSVFTAKDIILFWQSYQNIIIFVLLFTLAKYFSSKSENVFLITKFITISGVILCLLELLFILLPEQLLSLLETFIQQEMLDAYITNVMRNRYSLEMMLEVFYPFFLYYLIRKNSTMLKKVLFLLGTLILMYNTFFSNMRSRVVIAVFGLVFFGIVVIKKIRFSSVTYKNLITTFCILILTIFVSGFAIIQSSHKFTFNVIDRFLLENGTEDLGTVNFRIENVEKSLDYFSYSPVFGIGLGNYSLYNDSLFISPLGNVNYPSENSYLKNTTLSPHNIILQVLSETGVIGFLGFSLLFVYFMRIDYRYLRHNSLDSTCCYIISSWIIIVYGLFNPTNTIFVMGWFWVFRGVIDGSLNINNSKIYKRI